MQQHYPEVRAAGGEALLVCAATPPLLRAFLAENPLPFPAATDPGREAYAAFGLGRTSWGALLRPGVIAGYLRLMLRGWLPRRPGAGEDVLQLGGDFVLGPEGRLTYAHRSAEPTDRPPVAELLQAIRAAANPG